MTTEFKPHEACYWIIGRNNKSQAPAVLVDIHDEQSEYSDELRRTFPLVRHRSGKPSLARQARSRAYAYAATHNIPTRRVTHDDASTEDSAEC